MRLAKNIMNILNVAEKNDAAKNIAHFLSSGRAIRKEGASMYNKLYEFSYNFAGSNAKMIMTSVSGHLLNYKFPDNCKSWEGINPAELFEKPVYKVCTENLKSVKISLERLIRGCNMLIIWTDCDREGENIGMEIVNVCREVNPRISVKRAKFSQITQSSVTLAINNLVDMDLKVSQAVDVRQELDLRIGASFTRLQTLHLRRVFPNVLPEQVISYGSCQFPTLGFVVERFKAIENFKPEPFWKIVLNHNKNGNIVNFNWDRNRLFDEGIVTTLLENITDGGSVACVFDIATKPKSKWRPLALDTILMEKMGSTKLGINAKEIMSIAEKLYSQGFISYPRTETNIFPKDINLTPLVEIQLGDNRWRDFANKLLTEGINPNNGKKSDKAHPPIHPLKLGTGLSNKESLVYELVTRHFLACLSKNAVGSETKVSIECVSRNLGTGVWPLVNGQLTRSGDGEIFHITGLMIIARNYLEVYHYDNWSDKELPLYVKGEIFQPNNVGIEENSTTAPELLTEADLIHLMDIHGIGTDATHAEHISKVKERNYVGNVGQGDKYLVPGKLGMGLVEGYDLMGFFLSRPHLRANFEADIEQICLGNKQPQDVLALHIRQYKDIFLEAANNIEKLSEGVGKFLEETPIANNPAFNSTFPQSSAGDQLNVRACPKCSGSIIIKKPPTTNWMLGCTNYPACNHNIWLPSNVEIATVAKNRSSGSPIVCTNVHMNAKGVAVHKISLKFSTRMNVIADIIPDDDRNYVFCVYCNEDACTVLDIKHPRDRPTPDVIAPVHSSLTNPRPVGVVNNIMSGDSMQNHLIRSEGISSSNPVQLSYQRPPHPQPQMNNDTENSPLCLCRETSVKRTVVKEGPNKGRTFFTCATQTCNLFSWADGDAQSVPSGSTGASRTPNQTGDSSVNCDCQVPARLITVTKETSNKGRQFYGCQSRTCNFFQWFDETQSNTVPLKTKKRPRSDQATVPKKKTFTSTENMWPPMSNDLNLIGSTKTKAPRRCGRCKNPGHTAKTCPQN